MKRPLLMTLAAGAALSISACGKKGADGPEVATDKPQSMRTENPPAPEAPPRTPEAPTPPTSTEGGQIGQPVPEIIGNPPPPSIVTPRDLAARNAISTPKKGAPAYAEVKSPHPEGATNPPSPVLLVTPDGDCYKTWEGGMIPAGPDRVQTVEANDWTTQVQCPSERALGVFNAWIEAGKPVYKPE